jgi:hypothetical protein
MGKEKLELEIAALANVSGPGFIKANLAGLFE